MILSACCCAGAYRCRQRSAGGPAGPRASNDELKDNLSSDDLHSGQRRHFSAGTSRVTRRRRTLVDTKLNGWGQAVLDKVKSVTDKRSPHHQHPHPRTIKPEHGFFGATSNRRAREHKATGEMGRLKGDCARFLTKKTSKDKLTVGTGKDSIDLITSAGHTARRLIVFPALRVLTTGRSSPGRTTTAAIATTAALRRAPRRAKMIAGIKDVDTIIPGTPQSRHEGLQEFQRFTADLLSHREFDEGRQSVDDTAAAFKAKSTMGDKNERVKAAVRRCSTR